MSAPTGHLKTADEVLAGIDLSAKRVLVTGASGGLGRETARAMAARGAEVILAARDRGKLDAAWQQVCAETGSESVSTLLLDLASLSSVRAAAEDILGRYHTLDILVNNAGVMATPFSHTADGLESQFGVCHIGHFLFTCLLAPALIGAADARVVNLSSGGHKIAPVDFDDPNFKAREYDSWQAYGQAKTANVLFSLELDRRLSSKGVRAFAVHPGNIAETDLARHLTADDYLRIAEMMPPGVTQTYKSVGAGAATSAWAATAPELAGRGGIYLEDCQIAPIIANDEDADGGCRRWAIDPVAAQKLWRLSEEFVGQSFSW